MTLRAADLTVHVNARCTMPPVIDDAPSYMTPEQWQRLSSPETASAFRAQYLASFDPAYPEQQPVVGQWQEYEDPETGRPMRRMQLCPPEGATFVPSERDLQAMPGDRIADLARSMAERYGISGDRVLRHREFAREPLNPAGIGLAYEGLADGLGSVSRSFAALGASFAEAFAAGLGSFSASVRAASDAAQAQAETDIRAGQPAYFTSTGRFRAAAAGDMSLRQPGYVAQDGQDGEYDVLLDTRYDMRYLPYVGSEPTPTETERADDMPRRLDPKPCACGCGEMTKSGEFLRGHHTRRRWQLVKAVASAAEQTLIPGAGQMGARPAGEELAARGWAIPDTYRHFGVELEVIARDTTHVVNVLRGLNVNVSTGGYHARGGRGQWMLTSDSSVRANDAQRRRGLVSGFELVAPPLRGRKGLAEVTKVMKALEAAGVEVNKTCGGHVHHEARDFSLEAFKLFTRNYRNLQGAIDRVLAPSRRIAAGNQYCLPVSDYEQRAIDAATDVRSLTIAARGRYRVVNLQAFASYGTVEFRQHQGTVSAEKLTNWILLGQALVKAAKKGITIMPTASLAEAALALGMRADVAGYFARRQDEFAAAA